MSNRAPFNKPYSQVKIFRGGQPDALEREYKRWSETFTGIMAGPPEVTSVGNEIVICVFYEMPADA